LSAQKQLIMQMNVFEVGQQSPGGLASALQVHSMAFGAPSRMPGAVPQAVALQSRPSHPVCEGCVEPMVIRCLQIGVILTACAPAHIAFM